MTAELDTAADHAGGADVVAVLNRSGRGPVVLACEHASNVIPPEFGGLGLGGAALASHIAWDPGAFEVARAMARILDSPLVAPRVSRLVYDCNRPPEAETAVAAVSEVHAIPGNAGLSAADRRARAERYYAPFRAALDAVIGERIAAGLVLALVTVHSFTPVYKGVRRDLDLGIVHDADARLADALLAIATADGTLIVRRNAPYGPRDGVTHTLVQHALPRRLPNVMLEIRSDLIGDAQAQRRMAERLAGALMRALAAIGGTPAHPRSAGGRP